MAHVVIVGGGITGLATAFRLRRADPSLEITLLESRDRVGGNIHTEEREGYRIEWGPNGFLDSKPGMVQLCRDLGIGDRMIAASEGSRKNRYVFVRGKMYKLPGGPLALLTTPLLSLRGKWGFFTEPFRRRRAGDGDESIAEFVTRRAGKQAADIFADALVTGIHGGDPAQLSVAAAFPRLPEMERAHGSIIRGFSRAAKQKRLAAEARGEPRPGPPRMWSFREGLQVVVDALAHAIGADVIRTGTAVKRIERAAGWRVSGEHDSWNADAVVLTAPAYAQVEFLADVDPAIAQELAAIPYNRIAVAALGYRQADVPGSLDGFGYIAPQNTKRDVLGVQWCSSIFPDRAPPGMVLWRALVGGVTRADAADWPDEQLLKAVHDEMRITMGVKGEPVFHRIVRWPRAIPQYVLGHLERVRRIEAARAKHPGLFLTGNALHGIALNDCATQAEEIAAKVRAYMAG